MTFEFTGKNGDNNGYIYWLGTEGKTKKFENPHTMQRLRITSSGKDQEQLDLHFPSNRAWCPTRCF